MKGLTQTANGTYRFQFQRPDKKGRGAFRLGRMPKRAAEEIVRHANEILVVRLSGGRISEATAAWLGSIPKQLVVTLIKEGLIESSMAQVEETPTTLGAFLDLFMENSAATKKPNTQRQLQLTRKYLLLYFGDCADLRAITPGDADDFRIWLGKPLGKKKKALAENTIRRQCGRAKQVFRNALRRRLITENPFGDMRGIQVMGNPKTQVFVERATISSAIAACRSAEWRLIIALARFAGLRMHSEIRFFRWSDIDWAGGRMRITSPKTEHLPGGAWRDVPIFPDLRPYLEDARNEAAPGEEFVIANPCYRAEKANIRTPFLKILKKAGITPWPGLFKNLRSTCETELLNAGHDEWKVNRWIGHSRRMADKHYYQMRECDFLEASGLSEEADREPRLRNGSAGARNAPHTPAKEINRATNNPTNRGKDGESRTNPEIVNKRSVPRLGLEPRTL